MTGALGIASPLYPRHRWSGGLTEDDEAHTEVHAGDVPTEPAFARE